MGAAVARYRLYEDEALARVTRLLTLVDIYDPDGGPNARRMSVAARHEAVLEDGRRVVLLDDRGWTAQVGAFWTGDGPRPKGSREALPSIWEVETVDTVEEAARCVVGPDEPVTGSTHAEMEASHWETLASILREQGVEVEAAALRELPHDVELSTRLRARVSRRADASG